jgi:hypothetical protein
MHATSTIYAANTGKKHAACRTQQFSAGEATKMIGAPHNGFSSRTIHRKFFDPTIDPKDNLTGKRVEKQTAKMLRVLRREQKEMTESEGFELPLPLFSRQFSVFPEQ